MRSLFSTEAKRHLDRLRAEIEAESHSYRRLGDPYFTSGPLPKDPFLRALAVRVTHRVETTAHAVVVAGAVSDLFLEATDERGVIDAGKLAKRYGPRAVELLGAVTAIGPSSTDPRKIGQRIAQFGGTALRRRIGRAEPLVTHPKMRALTRLVRREAPSAPLRGVRVIAVQHLLGTTAALLRGLADSGVAPEDMLLFGKPYSQNQRVIDELRADGYHVQRMDVGQAAVAFNAMRIGQELLQKPTDGPILLIDDGGELIKYFHEHYPELHGRLIAVEQTRAGIRKLAGLDLAFPVIDVAQSWAKLRYEAPMIGRSVGKSVLQKLARLQARGIDTGRKIVFLGYGVIGRASARYLRGLGYEVATFDRSAAARADAERDGVATFASVEDALRQGHVVVSATGETTIDVAAAENLLPDGAILINAASPAELAPELSRKPREHELNMGPGQRLTAPFRGVDLDYEDVADGARRDRVLHTASGKQLLLVRDGGVVNFAGDVDPVPPRYIQLTRGLLYLGAMQAVRSRRPGIQALDDRVQREWVEAVEAELGESGESLLRPTF